jgi:two-component system chemotaxis response regulator CheY
VLVLVADDDASCRLVAKAIVERLGHECLVVGDGEQAWQSIQDRVVDVLITDWMMPGVDGPELCRRVRGAENRGYTYIILATSLTERDHVVEGMESGADDFLTKPLDGFDVETRLIAAARVTALHHQLTEFRTELERLNDELAALARTDPLTRLGNRLRLHEDLRAVHEHARRHRSPYALAVCDLDHFKRYNDGYGHLEGDDALRRVAATLAENCRDSDRAYRYGGEEFVIVFADEGLTGASSAAERLRRAVEVLAIPAPADEGGILTISVGVASWDPGRPDPVDVVLRQADEALYTAKDDGRNRVVAETRVPTAVPR